MHPSSIRDIPVVKVQVLSWQVLIVMQVIDATPIERA